MGGVEGGSRFAKTENFYRPQWSYSKVIFSQVCVKNSVHGGGEAVCLSACWDTPPGRHPPPGKTPPQADTPQPPGYGYYSGRYASYWNAFLYFQFLWTGTFRYVDFPTYLLICAFSVKCFGMNYLNPHSRSHVWCYIYLAESINTQSVGMYPIQPVGLWIRHLINRCRKNVTVSSNTNWGKLGSMCLCRTPIARISLYLKDVWNTFNDCNASLRVMQWDLDILPWVAPDNDPSLLFSSSLAVQNTVLNAIAFLVRLKQQDLYRKFPVVSDSSIDLFSSS